MDMHGVPDERAHELVTVLRTTARTTNFTVILIGAGLSAVLVYALASELFAKNSPTVLYGNACERIRVSPLVCLEGVSGSTEFQPSPSDLCFRVR